MRKFKFLLPLLAIPLLGIFSCGGNGTEDPYKGKIDIVGDKIIREGEMKTTYNAGEKIDSNAIGSLKVYYPSKSEANLIPFLDPAKDLEEKQYFITLDQNAPTLNRMTSSKAFNGNKRSESRDVYVAFLYNGRIVVSDGIKITVNNSSVINPVLYYVGGAVIIVGVAAIVVFAKKYKEKHPK